MLCLMAPILSLLAGCALAADRESEAGVYSGQPQVRAFIQDMVKRHQFDEAALEAMFAQVRRQDRILEVIQRPAEGKPWYEYRPIFLTRSRIDKGVQFWNAHAQTLARAEQVYGVPSEYVTAIIGVETYYGRRTGGFKVLDALTTLGFDYPKRARFFKSELEQYLLLTREESLDPQQLEGSYAGAMGLGQFISSSYRNYAVDFDEDGKRDLWQSTDDAIGSVANYFKRHGWSRGETVSTPAQLQGKGFERFLGDGYKPAHSLASLSSAGVTPDGPVTLADKAALLEYEGEDFKEYWLGFNNFYVITRYNHSPLYAMAVHQLAQEIKRNYLAQSSVAVEPTGAPSASSSATSE